VAKARAAHEHPARIHDWTVAADGPTGRLQLVVRIGLFSVLLGVPLAYLWEAAGPYDDPKAWALLILAMMTGLAWLVAARDGPPCAAVITLKKRISIPALKQVSVGSIVVPPGPGVVLQRNSTTVSYFLVYH